MVVLDDPEMRFAGFTLFWVTSQQLAAGRWE
jgi:hypothetical protein